MSNETTNAEILLTPGEVADRYKVTERTIRGWVAINPRFPQPIRFSRRAIRFRLADLEAFEQSDN